MIYAKRAQILRELDDLGDGVPFSHPQLCHLLFDLVSAYSKPMVVEVSCGYGRATIYLAAAARAARGFVRCVDHERTVWNDRTVEDLLQLAGLQDVCNVVLDSDARWYLLDLFQAQPGAWVDVAYLDASHTVEVDAFLGLAIWTHLRPGGILVMDDLDWIPAIYGSLDVQYSRPETSHIRAIYAYIQGLDSVDEAVEWGGSEIEWSVGLIRKRGGDAQTGRSVRDLLARHPPQVPQ